MSGNRIRRILRVVGYGAGALVVLFALAVALLRFTNPGPREARRWMLASQLPQSRGEVAAASVGTKLIVAGGLRGVGRTSDAVHVYDITRNEWTRARSLPSARHHAAGAGLGDHVYVSGGASTATDWTPTTTLWRAPPGLPWRSFARMPEGRQGHAMVALDRRLYVVGGVGSTDRTLIYDPARDRWTMGAPLPHGRDHLRAVAWKGEIWALGGRAGAVTSRVDIYNPRTDAWRPGPNLPEPMSAMAVGVAGGRLHVVGGEHPGLFGGRVVDAHYALSHSSERWSRAGLPILAVHGAGYAVLSDLLVVAGGAAREGVLSTISWTPVTQIYFPQGFPKRVQF